MEKKIRSVEVLQRTTNRKSKFSIPVLQQHMQELEKELEVVVQEVNSWLEEGGLDEEQKKACRRYYLDGISNAACGAEFSHISNLERDVKRELGLLDTRKKEPKESKEPK